MASKFMPSAAFLARINTTTSAPIRDQQFKLVDRILKELELIDYFHPKCPKTLTDKHWTKLLKMRSVAERLSFIEYVALNERREQNDQEIKRKSREEFTARIEQERIKYESGAMGYGPQLYQLMMNPLRNEKHINHIEGARQYISETLVDTPKIAFDLQYFSSMSVQDASKMAAQVELTYKENNEVFRRPFRFEYLNFKPEDPAVASNLVKLCSIFKSTYTDQRIVPDFYSNMHYKLGDRNVYYVTKFAKRFFDGPLDPEKTIIIPATMDRTDQSFQTCYKHRFTPIYLPIRKYIKWESGAFYMPIPNIVRTLHKVADTGGDWRTAIEENVAIRHRRTIEEQRDLLKGHYDKKQEEKRQKQEIIKMLEDTVKDSSIADVKARLLST